MSRKYKGKFETMHTMGLARNIIPPPSAPTSNVDGQVKVNGAEGAQFLKDQLVLQKDYYDWYKGEYGKSVANDKDMFASQKNFQWGAMGWGAVKDLMGAFFNWKIFGLMSDQQEHRQTLETKVVDHKIALDNTVVEKQADALDDKNKLTLNLAETEANKQKWIAQVNADVKLEIAKANATAKAFALYSYGKPLQPIAV